MTEINLSIKTPIHGRYKKRKMNSVFSFVLLSSIEQKQISYEDPDKVKDVTFFVVVGYKTSKRHYFSGLALDSGAVILNSIFLFFCRTFLLFRRKDLK